MFSDRDFDTTKLKTVEDAIRKAIKTRSSKEFKEKLQKYKKSIILYVDEIKDKLKTTEDVDQKMKAVKQATFEVVQKIKTVDTKRRAVINELKLIDYKIALTEAKFKLASSLESRDFLEASRYFFKIQEIEGNTQIFTSFQELKDSIQIPCLIRAVSDIEAYSAETFQSSEEAKVVEMCTIFDNLGLKQRSMEKYVKHFISDLDSEISRQVQFLFDPNIALNKSSEVFNEVVFADLIVSLIEKSINVLSKQESTIIQNFISQDYARIYLLKSITRVSAKYCIEVVHKFIEIKQYKQRCHVLAKIQSDHNFGSEVELALTPMTESEAKGKFSALDKLLNVFESNPLVSLDNYIDRLVLVLQHLVSYREFISLKLDHIHHQDSLLQDVKQDLDLISNAIQDLIGFYGILEESYIRFALLMAAKEKYIEYDDMGKPLSSLVSDIFFVYEKVIYRSISTKDVNCICMILNNVSYLHSQYIPVYVRESSKDGNYSTETLFNSIIEIINLTTEISLSDTTNENEAIIADLKVQSCVNELSRTHHSLLSLQDGVKRDVLKSILDEIEVKVNDTYNNESISYEITEEEYSFLQENEVNLRPLEDFLGESLSSLKAKCTRQAFMLLVEDTVKFLCKLLSNAIKKKSFTLLGAMIFEKDMKALLSFINNFLDPNHGAQSFFEPLLQSLAVLTVYERADVEILTGDLSATDVRNLLLNRIDLKN